jgi:tape measure domain-containing protein
MTDFATLGMVIDSSGLVRGRDELGRLTDAGGRAEDRLTRNAGTISRVWARLSGVLAGAFSIREVSRAADRYTQMTNLLRSMGASAEGAARELQGIADVAKRTRAPLDAMASLYQRISIASDELGASQKDALRFTENIGLALAQQGGSAAAASGALLQLSQAMGAGTVRAEEFNSILEGAFPIAQAAARGIDAAGGSVAKLRQLVVDGKISSDEFFRAILSQTDQLEAAFANTVPTIAQAFGQLSDSFTMFIGQADSATGVSALLAQGIIAIADNLQLAATIGATAAVFFGVKLAAAFVASQIAAFSLTGALLALRAALAATGIGALIIGAGLLADSFIRLVQAAGSFAEAFRLSRNVVIEVADRIAMRVSALGQDILSFALGVESGFKSAMAATAEAVGAGVRAVAGGVEGVINVAIQGITSLVNIGIAGINKLIELANKVPGIDIGTVGEFGGGSFALGGGITAAIDGVAEGLRNSSNAARQAAIDTGAYADILNELAGQPLQSVNALKQVLSDANSVLKGEGGEDPTKQPITTDPTKLRGAGAGGGGLLDDMQRLNELLGQFQEQDPRAAIEAWHSEAMAALNDANLIERGMLEEHSAYKLKIEELYQQQLAQIRQNASGQQLKDAAGFFGAMASVAQAGGDRMIKVAQAFSAIQGLINSWAAYTEMLKDPSFIGRPWARFAAAASVLAAGLNAVKAIKGAGSSSARPGSSGGAASAPAAPSAPSGGAGQTIGQSPTTTFAFTIQNDPAGFGESFARQMIDQLNEAQRNGGQVRGVLA